MVKWFRESKKMEEVFEETSLRVNVESPMGKFFKYLSKSSLFIFHETWSIRKFLLILVLGSDNLINREQAIRN